MKRLGLAFLALTTSLSFFPRLIAAPEVAAPEVAAGVTVGANLVFAWADQRSALRPSDTSAEPRSLAAADFDGDGVTDLVLGLETPRGARVALHRGDPRALRSARRAADPFLAPPALIELPEVPRFLAAGDFDADGHADLAAAGTEEALVFLAGDGTGTFATPEIIALPGRVTAMVAGELHRPDGLPELVVGVAGVGEHGEPADAVLVFAPLRDEPQRVELDNPAHALALGPVGAGRGHDLAIASGRRLVLVHGPLGEERAQRVDLPFVATAMTAGAFGEDPRGALALLDEADGVHRLELRAGRWQLDGQELEPSAEPNAGHEPHEPHGDHGLLVPTRLTNAPGADVVLARSGRLRFLRGKGLEPAVPDLTFEGRPLSVLSLRLDDDAWDDLVVLTESGLSWVRSQTDVTFVVDSTADTPDSAPGDGVCDDGEGHPQSRCTLRAAIDEANALQGFDRIEIRVPESDPGYDSETGVVTFRPLEALPAVSDPAVLDATTQDGKVVLDGALAGAAGLNLAGGGSTVRGFSIHSFQGDGILVTGSGGTSAGGNVIEGNFLGLDAGAGADPDLWPAPGNGGWGVVVHKSPHNDVRANVIAGNALGGVSVRRGADGTRIRGNRIGTDPSGSSSLANGVGAGEPGFAVLLRGVRDVVVGGTEPGAGNLIAGAGSGGGVVVLQGRDHRIQGNLVGTDASGALAFGHLDGVVLSQGSEGVLVGGTSASASNVISGNVRFGVSIVGQARDHLVAGNLVGADASGRPDLGNGDAGVRLLDTSGHRIGGEPERAGNVIAGNGGAGVLVQGRQSRGNSIRGNRIFANADLGIDVEPAGAVSEEGAPMPEVSSVVTGGTTRVEGSLTGTPETAYVLEFFVNSLVDPSDHGEGESFLGSTTVKTDAAGTVSFSASFEKTLSAGGAVSATSTDSQGTTSEFSACAEVAEASTTVSWINAAGGLWSDPANWSTGTVPASGADVYITLDGIYTVTLDVSAMVGNLTLGGANGQQTLQVNSGSLTVDGAGGVGAAGVLSLVGGTLRGNGDLEVAGLFLWSGGTLTGAGRVLVHGQMEFAGTSVKTINAKTLDVAGTALVTGAGRFDQHSGSVVNVLAGGTFDFQANMTWRHRSGASTTVNNSGLVKSTTTTTLSSVTFNNDGEVRAEAGTITLGAGASTGRFEAVSGAILTLTGAHDFLPGSLLTGAGNVRLEGTSNLEGRCEVSGSFEVRSGTANFNTTLCQSADPFVLNVLGGTAWFHVLSPAGVIGIDLLSVSGGNVRGEVAVNRLFTWTGGRIHGPGCVLVNGQLDFAGTGTKTINNMTLDVAGTALVTGGGRFDLQNGSLVNVLAGGTFDFRTNMTWRHSAGALSTVNNSGLVKSTTTTTLSSVTFNNDGEVRAEAGTITLGAGASTGRFEAVSGAILTLTGAHDFLPGSLLTGAGNVRLEGTPNLEGRCEVSGLFEVRSGTANFNTTLCQSADPFVLNVLGGTAQFNVLSPTGVIGIDLLSVSAGNVRGEVAVNRLFTWAGGRILGPGRILVNGQLDFAGTGTKTINNMTLDVAGTALVTGGGRFDLQNGSLVNVLAGGTFDFRTNMTWRHSAGALSTVNNSGLVKSTTTTTLSSVTFNNDGEVRAEAGTITLGAGASTGRFEAVSGAILTLTGAHDFLPGSLLTGAGNVRLEGTPNLEGRCEVSGSFEVRSGTANFNTTLCQSADPFVLNVLGGTAWFHVLSPTGVIGIDLLSVSGGNVRGEVAVNSLFTWTGGRIHGPGRILVNGQLDFAGTGTKTINNMTLDVAGTALVTGGGRFDLQNGSLVNVLAGGTFDFRTNMTWRHSAGALSTVNNSGLVKSTTTTTLSSVTFNNDGEVRAEAGTITLGAGASTGRFEAVSGAILTLTGAHDFLPGSLLTGAGNVRLEGTPNLEGRCEVSGSFEVRSGTANFNTTLCQSADPFVLNVLGGTAQFNVLSPTGAIGIDLLSVSGGNVRGEVAVNRLFTWAGGRILGPGRILVNGQLDFAGTGTKTINAMTLDVAGTALVTGTGRFDLHNGSVVNILAEGTFDVQSNMTWRHRSGVLTTVNNSGLFQQSGGNRSLSLAANYTQTSSGSLAVDVAGLSDFDRFALGSGTATLDGHLEVRLVGGFVPQIGDRFDILTAAGRAGEFSSVAGSGFEVIYTATGVSLSTVDPNRAPTAADDSAATQESNPVTIDVLANDSDPDGDTIDVHSFDPASAQGGSITLGSVTLDGTTLLYTPAAGFAGTDTFTYDVADPDGEVSGRATVTVVVNGSPRALNDAAEIDEDTSVVVDVLANDSDGNGDPLTVVDVTTPLAGTAELQADQTVLFAARPDFFGTDSFSYTVSDGGGGLATARVTINVLPVEDPPRAVDDSAATSEELGVLVAVLANDSDPENAVITVAGVADGAHGTAAIQADQSVLYVPETDFFGTDTFTYTVNDGALTATGTVTVTVSNVPDVPTAVDDSVTTEHDTPVEIAVTANDASPDGDELVVSSVTPGLGGVPVILADGVVRFDPDPGFAGDGFFYYRAQNTSGLEDEGHVTVTVLPDLTPDALDDTVLMLEDDVVTIPVLANDSAQDLAVATVTLGAPAHGTAAIQVDQTVVYTPNPDFFGTDSFTYTLSDVHGSDTATVSVTVEALPDFPVAVDDHAETALETLVEVPVLANDHDPDGGQLFLAGFTPPGAGTVEQRAGGVLAYMPPPFFSGEDSFYYTVENDTGEQATARVTVVVGGGNQPPLAQDDNAVTETYFSVEVNVLFNDTDPDGDALTVTSVSDPPSGTADDFGSGIVLYTPDPGFSGTDTFTYTVSDGTDTSSATVTVTVNPG